MGIYYILCTYRRCACGSVCFCCVCMGLDVDWQVSEGVCGVSITFMYMYYMHSRIYPEMACIRLGENAGVMDLAVKCTLQVRVCYFSYALMNSIMQWNLSI